MFARKYFYFSIRRGGALTPRLIAFFLNSFHRFCFSILEEEAKELAARVPFNPGDHPSKITVNQYHNWDDVSRNQRRYM